MARILVVDDDLAIRNLLRRALSSEGHQVSTATNGREALDQIAEEVPELLILDLMMPVMSGWEVYCKLRSENRIPLSIIVLTAGTQAALAQQSMEEALVLSKPFDLDSLLSAIETITGGADGNSDRQRRAA